MDNLPIIKIKYAKLLDPFLRDFVIKKYPSYEFPSREEVEAKVVRFQAVWAKEGSKILHSMLNFFPGTKFERNLIDCYIVSAIDRDMSSPLIIRSRYNEMEFLEALTHELVHILASDSKQILSANESKRVANHIPVYRFLREIGFATQEPKDPFYKTAWELSKII